MTKYLSTGYATNATSGGNWSRNQFADSYTFNYPCGHGFEVPGNAMQRGGQVVPPLCPTCHGQKVIDKMEADNWNQNPKWQGYATGQATGRQLEPLAVPSGVVAWLDYQIGTVRQKAWH